MLSLIIGLWPGFFVFCIPFPRGGLQSNHKIALYLLNSHAIIESLSIFCLVGWYFSIFDVHLDETVDEISSPSVCMVYSSLWISASKEWVWSSVPPSFPLFYDHRECSNRVHVCLVFSLSKLSWKVWVDRFYSRCVWKVQSHAKVYSST